MNKTLSKILTPVKPVLRPIRDAVLGKPEPKPKAAPKAKVDLDRWDGPTEARTDLPIRTIVQSEFDEVAALNPEYYKGRATYMSKTAGVIQELIERRGLTTALELGPWIRSMVVGADVMDLNERENLRYEGSLTIGDARKTPWPFDDRAYDLFVALQVFEHLGTSQPDAFREVRRVARHAVLSLPIEWVMKDPTNGHHMLTIEKVNSWTAPVVPTAIIEGNAGAKRRVIFVYEDLPPLDDEPAS